MAKKESIVPGLGKKQLGVLNNEHARQLEHKRHLEELGFPEEVEPDFARHAPVSYDDPSNPTPSRVVNQAGQDLGDPNKEDSDHFDTFEYKPAKKIAKEAFLDFMQKQDPPPPDPWAGYGEAQRKKFKDLGFTRETNRNPTATDVAAAQSAKDIREWKPPDTTDPNLQEASWLSDIFVDDKGNPTGVVEYNKFKRGEETEQTYSTPWSRAQLETDTGLPKIRTPETTTFAGAGRFPNIKGTGKGGGITYRDINPITGDVIEEASIEKSMEIFNNLVKENGDEETWGEKAKTVFNKLKEVITDIPLTDNQKDKAKDDVETLVEKIEKETKQAHEDRKRYFDSLVKGGNSEVIKLFAPYIVIDKNIERTIPNLKDGKIDWDNVPQVITYPNGQKFYPIFPKDSAYRDVAGLGKKPVPTVSQRPGKKSDTTSKTQLDFPTPEDYEKETGNKIIDLKTWGEYTSYFHDKLRKKSVEVSEMYDWTPPGVPKPPPLPAFDFGYPEGLPTAPAIPYKPPPTETIEVVDKIPGDNIVEEELSPPPRDTKSKGSFGQPEGLGLQWGSGQQYDPRLWNPTSTTPFTAFEVDAAGNRIGEQITVDDIKSSTTPINYKLGLPEGVNETTLESIQMPKDTVYTFQPRPVTVQDKMNISPDDRLDPIQRAQLATTAYNREMSAKDKGSETTRKLMEAGALVDPTRIKTSMDSYQEWIQKAENEGAMAKVQLDRVSDLADMMHDALDENDELPGWIQNKISDSLHNLEASITHIAYDKKQDMELSKASNTFTNILQKDEGALAPVKAAYGLTDAVTGGQLGYPKPKNFAAWLGVLNEISKNPNIPRSWSDLKAGAKSLFWSGKPSKNPLKLGPQALNKINQFLEPVYGKDTLNFKKPWQMAKPFTVGTPGSILRGAVKGGAAGVGASLAAEQLLPIYSDILFPELSDSSKETLQGLASLKPQSTSKMLKLTGDIAQQVVPSPERMNQRKNKFMSVIESLKNVGGGNF